MASASTPEESVEPSISAELPSTIRNRIFGFSGIPDNLEVLFIDKPPPNIVCVQCQSLVPSLWRFPCGHGFCANCFERAMPSDAVKSICPIDQQSVSRKTVFQETSIQESGMNLRVYCPFDCGPDVLSLSTLPLHLLQCKKVLKTLSVKRCFLRGLGCLYESDVKEDLIEHESDLQVHRTLISSKIQDLITVDELRNKLNEAMVGLYDATKNQSELTERMEILEGRLEQLQHDRSRARSNSLPDVNAPGPSAPQPTFAFQLGPMSITTFGSEHHLPSLGATSTIRGAQELTCPDGTFQWKLSQYARAKFKERHSLHKKYTSSPSFYAGSPGYHFKLRLHLNGIGSSGRGKYLAVGIVLLKGQFDEQLGFPIHNPITVSLIDQTTKCPENVDFHLPDPSFVKPKSDYTVPCMWHEFISIEDLESPRFLVNDTIIFRVKVSPLQNENTPVPPPNCSLYPSLG